MNMINIVEILYMYKLVLDVELLKNTIIDNILNKNVGNFIDCF